MIERHTDWRAALDEWLKENSKTIPDELRRVRDDFVRHFPPDLLSELTLDQYAVGKPDSFCYWLEFKTRDLGSISGGSSHKFGIYWSAGDQSWHWNKLYQTADEAFGQMKKGLVALVSAVKSQQFDALDTIGAEYLGANRYSLRCKPLALYFPDEFLAIANPKHVATSFTSLAPSPKAISWRAIGSS